MFVSFHHFFATKLSKRGSKVAPISGEMSSDPVKPVGEESLTVAKSMLSGRGESSVQIAGIDRGSTLTKIMYSSSVSDDPSSINLHFALFRNKHFDSALRFLKQKLTTADQLEKGRKLHVTGVGANRFGEKIKEELGVDIEFVDEVYCQFAGFHFLLKHFAVEAICHPLPTIDDPMYSDIKRNEMIKRFREKQKAAMLERDTGDKFPCLFGIFGSSAGIVLINEDGSIVVKHRHLLAGKSFLGMCQLLLGTSDYAAIMQMAAVGKRGNIDTQVKDIMANEPNSPYGKMPPTMPVFPFGKAVDFDKSLSDVNREDLAHSLISSFTVNFVLTMVFVATFERVRNIFIGGNFFKHEVPRQEVARYLKVADMTDTVRLNFLKTGHTAALGAMLSNQKNVADFFADMKIK